MTDQAKSGPPLVQPPAPEIDAANRFAVGLGVAGDVHVLGLVVLSEKMKAGGLTEDDALNLAAWLVAVVGTANPSALVKFVRLHAAISKT